MKFNIISTALLAAVAIGAIEVAEIKNMKSGNAGKVLVEIYKSGADVQADLIKTAFEVKTEEKARRELFAKVTGHQARSMKLDKVVVGENTSPEELGLILSMSSDAIKVFGLDSTIKALKAYKNKLESYANFPLDYFKNEDFLRAAMANLGKDVQTIFTLMSLEQFSKVMSNCPKFHSSTLTGASLNALAAELSEKKLNSFIAKVSPKFLDSINSSENKVALEKKVVQALPVNFLNEIKFSPAAEDGQYYTAAQLKAYNKDKDQKIDLSQVPPKKVENLNPEVLRKHIPLTQEQVNKLSVTQWNELLLKKAGCQLITEGTKLPNVSAIKFTAKCFAQIDAGAQAYVLTHHTSLPDDILAHITAEMVEKWSIKSESGLDILRHCSNKNILAHIGTEVDEEAHPLNDLSPSKLAKKLKTHMAAITADQLSVMNIAKPKSLADLRKDAEWVCYRDDIFDTIDRMSSNNKRQSEKKQSVWPALTAKDIERLTAPKYSKLGSSMSKEVYERLQPAAAAAFSPRAVAQFTFLKNLTAEQYAKLPAEAFSYLSTSNTGKFNIVHVTDAQLPLISSQVRSGKSYFSAVQADEMQALGFARLSLLSAAQWGDLKPAVFKAVFTKALVPTIPATSMVNFTAAQVSQLSAEILNLLSADQVNMIGSEIINPNLSGRKVLNERKSELSSQAQTSLIQAEPKAQPQMSGAASVGSFSVLAMAATAGLALLL